MKRILSFFTLACIAFVTKAEILPATSFAGGKETFVDPHQISNITVLSLLMDSSKYWSDTLQLTASIDASKSESWKDSKRFTARNILFQCGGVYSKVEYTETERKL